MSEEVKEVEAAEPVVEAVEPDSVKEMSDDALKAIIENAKRGEPAAEPEVEESAAAEPVADEAVATEEPASREKELAEKVARLESELAKKTKTVDRMGNELGTLRQVEERLRQLESQKASAEKIGLDKLVEDPDRALSAVLENKSRDAEITQLKAEYARRQVVQQNQQFFQQHVPDLESKWDSIAEVIREDGADPSVIRDRLYEIDPLTVFNLTKRAELARQVKELAAQVDRLKSKTPEVLKKVEAASKVGVKVTGKTSGVSSSEGQFTKPMREWSDQELASYLKSKGVRTS